MEGTMIINWYSHENYLAVAQGIARCIIHKHLKQDKYGKLFTIIGKYDDISRIKFRYGDTIYKFKMTNCEKLSEEEYKLYYTVVVYHRLDTVLDTK